jgi:hypothetical protein
MPTDAAVLERVSISCAVMSERYLPAWGNAFNRGLDNFRHSGAIDSVHCSSIGKLYNVLRHVRHVFRVHHMRSANFLRHLQSAVNQIDCNDLFHPEVLRPHQSRQAHTSQAEYNDAFVLLRLQDVENRPCTRLE